MVGWPKQDMSTAEGKRSSAQEVRGENERERGERS